MIVRAFQDQDIDAICTLDANSNPYPWRVNSLQECLMNDLVWVFEDEGRVLGFAIFYNAVDCLELMLVVTDRLHRRQGLARSLITAGLQYGLDNGFEQCVLEVRQSNKVAQDLYLSMGCVQVGTRKNYYPLNGGHEDALLFSHRYVR
jgi:[ribosomal protein S18]-alanine N-acetyltransferase